MRAPSLLAQCLPGLAAQDHGSQSISSVPEKEIHLPSPAVEILPSKAVHPYKYSGESVDLQGVHVFKGRVSIAEIIGFSGSDVISSKPEGYLKSWDSSIDLVSVLKHETRDGQLSFRGKRVLELNCNYGLSGIFACLKGASMVHFQDQNAETMRCTTIPNVLANLEQARDQQSRQPESPLTPSRQTLAPLVHFYAGDWEELPSVLSVVKNDGYEVTPGEAVHGRASEADQGEGGYDVILMAEIPYSVTSLKKLYAFIKKCLRPPYGVVYLPTKKNYVGFNNGARQLRSLVDEEGIFGAHLVKEFTNRDIWKFFHK
ncbi:hypothetical protein L6164_019276 [Bauhinia variegata]|uniref:Uncharacterized protein n=1 Tax=Bauhinia variegata TaxID=167791 RepID=A0ACB9NFV7_BAUVA|nr:hypothetical protein L6164_019276 [Bauhinia variegata]